MRILTSVGPSICPHVLIQELLNEFLLNLILVRNTNIFRHIPFLVLVVVVVVHVDDVRLCPWTAAPRWYMIGKPRWNDIDKETDELEEKPAPVLLCLPQIPHGLTPLLSQASAVIGQRLTAWSMALPCSLLVTIRQKWHVVHKGIHTFLCASRA
jgi:hypothetical protein